MLDVQKLIDGVHDYIGRALSPLAMRVKALEDRPHPERGEKGDSVSLQDVEPLIERAVAKLPKAKDGNDGKDADMAALERFCVGLVRDAIAAVPKPRDGEKGKDADPAEVRAEVERQIAAIGDVKTLIAREVSLAVASIPAPRDGKDADMMAVERMVRDAVASIPKPRDGIDGKDCDPLILRAAVRDEVDRAVSLIPAPKDGKDADPVLTRATIIEEVARAVSAIPAPRDGKDADPEHLRYAVAAEVSRAVAALPKPENGKDGKDVDPASIKQCAAEVLPGLVDQAKGILLGHIETVLASVPGHAEAAIFDAVEKAVAAIPRPQDGKSVTVDDVRPIFEAESARWALEFERRAGDLLQRAVDRMPKPEKGRDGIDGFQLDDFTAETKDGRTIILRLKSCDREITRSITLSGLPIERGVYRAGVVYTKGDGVTYGGSFWIAETDPTGPPPGNGWRLAVKGSK